MAQSNYNIPNDSAPAVRAQLNSVFQSIVTNNSGSAAPTTTFPHQWWYDSTANILKQRNAADSAWIDIGTFDQSGGTFSPAGVGQLTQGQAEDPASTVFGAVSGQRLGQSINANVDTAKVLAETAGATYGAVGTYAWLASIGTTTIVAGSTYSGSGLTPAGAYANTAVSTNGVGNANGSAIGIGSGSLSGTWRAMGSFVLSSATTFTRGTLFLRIS